MRVNYSYSEAILGADKFTCGGKVYSPNRLQSTQSEADLARE